MIHEHIVGVTFNVDGIDLSFDQMSTITMLVLEVANNSQKYVFQRGLGSSFWVSLKALPDGQAMLTIRDDERGLAQNVGCDGDNQRLGRRIMRDLATELDGTLSRTPGGGHRDRCGSSDLQIAVPPVPRQCPQMLIVVLV
jgi:two-component sensor histidine kinase